MILSWVAVEGSNVQRRVQAVSVSPDSDEGRPHECRIFQALVVICDGDEWRFGLHLTMAMTMTMAMIMACTTKMIWRRITYRYW